MRIKWIRRKSLLVTLAALMVLAMVVMPLAGCTTPAPAPTTAPAPAPTTAPAPAPTTAPAPAPTTAPAPTAASKDTTPAAAPTTGAAKTPKEVVIGYSGPLSGPAADYGKECLDGVDMAIKDINAKGGITVGDFQVKFKLEKLDDAADPTQSVNNARRLRNQNKAIAVFNPVYTGIAPTMNINEEPGNEFIMMAYTSTPGVESTGNKLTVVIPPPFTSYIRAFVDQAKSNGWKNGGMIVTAGAYGDAWRKYFKAAWEAAGGTITADKPGNYYTETDYSAQITAVKATNPDFILIGGPSAPTALVVEQARNLGFKGGLILIDQAKQDYVAHKLGGLTMLEGTIGVAAVAEIPNATARTFDKRYSDEYKGINTWETVLDYDAMWALALAMQKAGTTDDVKAIRAGFPSAFPMLGDKYPVECWGINDDGRMWISASTQSVKDGKYTPPQFWVHWAKTEEEFNKIKNAATGLPAGAEYHWLKPTQ